MRDKNRISAYLRFSAVGTVAVIVCAFAGGAVAESHNYSYSTDPTSGASAVPSATGGPEQTDTQSSSQTSGTANVKSGSGFHLLSETPQDESLAARPSPYASGIEVTAQPVPTRVAPTPVVSAPVAPSPVISNNYSAPANPKIAPRTVVANVASDEEVPAPVIVRKDTVITAAPYAPPIALPQNSSGTQAVVSPPPGSVHYLDTTAAVSAPMMVASVPANVPTVMPPTANLPPIPSTLASEQKRLSPQSKAIADTLPPEKIKKEKKREINVEHEQKNPLDSQDVREHKGVGISISIHKPKPNISHMLEEAYDALIAGNQEDAIALYKEVLAEQPQNKLALFGLATTYHRAGQLQLARPLYGKLLAIDPHNEEGLNNFLVLLADESPAEALEEMKKLQHTHPDFSPLPAQMAVIYQKMGDYRKAIDNMGHAIELSPENAKYRYDMAVILDKSGDWNNAAIYYQQLITANERGEKIPASAEEIQERLTFIRSNKPKT